MAGESPGNKWAYTVLSDISSDIAYGYTQSASEEKVGPHFLRITDIQDGIVDWHSVPYCPISTSDHAKYKLECGDIVVARTGNSTGENFIFRANEDAVFASYLIRFRIDSNEADPLFVWYCMRTPAWWSFINNSKTGSAQAGANAKVLGQFELPLPSPNEQRAIAEILGSLDDKIELNRRMNRALEGMARAIFKAWFIDFEPVKAKAAGATSFRGMPQPVFDQLPDRFVDSPIGPVPEGWEAERVDSACTFNYGKALKASDRSGGVVPVYGSNGVVGWHDKALTDGPGVVVGRKGNPGTVVWVQTEFYPIDTTFFVTPARVDCPLSYLRFALEYLRLDAYGSDSAVPGLSRKMAYGLPIVVPDVKTTSSFDELFQSFQEMVHANEHESRVLAGIRDALLPKLISGELRVDAAARGTQEVA